jgi:type I restriction enzyme S subunit
MMVATEVEERNFDLKNKTLLSLSYGRIIIKDIDSNDGLLPESFESYQVLKPNDIVLRLTDLQNDKRSLRTALCAHSGIITSAYLGLRPKAGFSLYLSQLLHSYDITKVFYSLGGGLRQTIKFDDVRRLPIIFPTSREQSAIAAFLDQETGKIDALVAEQERLIALLKEKRQAVISQAVTKGLNPNAPMKDSGIEWLGQVPAHWEIRMLKRAFRSVDYGISDALSPEGEIVVLRMNNIQNGSISFEDLKYTDSVDPQLLLEAGDLLYNRTNSLELIGKVGVYKGEFDMPLSFASYLVRFRLFDGAPDYFAYLLNTRGILGIVRSSAYVAIGQCNLNPTKYGEISVALPAPEEQAAIVDFLNAEVSRTDTLITEATQAITLLRERRAALISAAVTGKIDVRALAPSQPEAA